MDTVRLSDVFWISLAAFAGFELALAANYLFLKVLLRAMSVSIQRTGINHAKREECRDRN